MTDLPKLPFLLLFALITACGGFNTGVKKSDTQKVNTVKYGTLVAAEPVKITGESSGIGALTGGLVGFVVECACWAGVLDLATCLTLLEACCGSLGFCENVCEA